MKDTEKISSSRADRRSFDSASRDEAARRSAPDDNFYIDFDINFDINFYINQLLTPGLSVDTA